MHKYLVLFIFLLSACTHHGEEKSPHIQALSSFAENEAKKHSMEFLLATSYLNGHMLLFKSQEKITQEELAPIIESIISDANTRFKGENIHLKIGFWDENMDPIMPPYISEVVVKNNTIFYYQRDPKTLLLKQQ